MPATLGRPAVTTVALALVAAGAVVAAILVIGSPSTSSAQERTVTVARGVVQSTVSGSGNLEPANQVELNFATSGEITHIYVKEGEHVGEGQVLAKLDDSAAKVDVAEAQATLQSAQDTRDQVESQGSSTATTAAAQASGGSGSGSGASGSGASGSGSSGSGSTITLAAAQADVESAQLSVTSAEEELAATTLRAPMAGTIAAVDGEVGQKAGSGLASANGSSSSGSNSSSSIAGGLGGAGGSGSSSSSGSSGSSFITLAQISRFKMDVALSESDIGSVKVGQPATVTVNAASGEQFAAHVTHIGVLSSSSGGSSSSSAVSYPVTLTLDKTGKKLKAGMSATADIVTAQVSGIAIPSQALSGSTVTVEDAKGTQSTRQVQTGVVGDSTTQIVSGLKVGETVVVRATTAAAGASGANQINDAIRNRLGRNGLSGGLGSGGGFGGGGGALRAAPGPVPGGGP